MEPFEISKYKSLFLEPNDILRPSAWIEHIPFAFFLIDILQPLVFVELGTHTGNSFNVFCQIVKTLNLNTKCYAVDKWEGDIHAGFYSTEVFEKLERYQQQHYKSFSQLMRMSFDEASKYFNDGSIDLLHIDGLHTYEAVKHDFDTWLPKLSSRSVVIFHDTFVRRDDFGVWKLWEELSSEYLSYNFNHAYGLGVLVVGTDVSEEFINFIKMANENSFMQNLFSRLGEYIQYKDELKSMTKVLDDTRAVLCETEKFLECRNIELDKIKRSLLWKLGKKIIDFIRIFLPKV